MTAMTKPLASSSERELLDRARRLGFWGLVGRFSEFSGEPWLEPLLRLEEEERQRRGLERRVKEARLGRFKPMCDFDWKWPKLDRELLEEIFRFEFLQEASNVVLVGPNGIGKTMIAKNLAHQAILRGHTARFITASELLNELVAQESGSALSRRLRQYSRPGLLVIDEVGYLSGSARHGDLLFEVITRRYQEKSIVLTTNKPFSEWNEVFPSSGCVVTLVDRLVHRAEIVKIDGESYRLKEARERREEKARERARKRRQRKEKS
jgi:DNA replication protein DnaC